MLPIASILLLILLPRQTCSVKVLDLRKLISGHRDAQPSRGRSVLPLSRNASSRRPSSHQYHGLSAPIGIDRTPKQILRVCVGCIRWRLVVVIQCRRVMMCRRRSLALLRRHNPQISSRRMQEFGFEIEERQTNTGRNRGKGGDVGPGIPDREKLPASNTRGLHARARTRWRG